MIVELVVSTAWLLQHPILKDLKLKNLRVVPPYIKADYVGVTVPVPLKIDLRVFEDKLWVNLGVNVGDIVGPTASRMAAKFIAESLGWEKHGGALKVPGKYKALEADIMDSMIFVKVEL